MKKLILIPKKDTVTICLPPDWVGKRIICTWQPIEELSIESTSIASENNSDTYQATPFTKKTAKAKKK